MFETFISSHNINVFVLIVFICNYSNKIEVIKNFSFTFIKLKIAKQSKLIETYKVNF